MTGCNIRMLSFLMEMWQCKENCANSRMRQSEWESTSDLVSMRVWCRCCGWAYTCYSSYPKCVCVRMHVLGFQKAILCEYKTKLDMHCAHTCSLTEQQHHPKTKAPPPTNHPIAFPSLILPQTKQQYHTIALGCCDVYIRMYIGIARQTGLVKIQNIYHIRILFPTFRIHCLYMV